MSKLWHVHGVHSWLSNRSTEIPVKRFEGSDRGLARAVYVAGTVAALITIAALGSVLLGIHANNTFAGRIMPFSASNA